MKKKLSLEATAITEMVPDFIWAPYFFGPREIRSPRNLGPTKVRSCMKMLCNDFHAGIKFLWAQTFQGPNFSGTKFLGGPKKTGPNEAEDHFSYSRSNSLVVHKARWTLRN